MNTYTDQIKDQEKMMEDYLASLNPKEKKAYNIAKSHLGMSFDLQKSNGFIEYKNNIEKENK